MAPNPRLEILNPIFSRGQRGGSIIYASGGFLQPPAEIGFTLGTSQAQRLIYLPQGAFDEPAEIGIQLFAANDLNVQTVFLRPFPLIRAILTWGWEGNSPGAVGPAKAFLDVTQGFSVSVLGSYLSLDTIQLPVLSQGRTKVFATAGLAGGGRSIPPTLTVSSKDGPALPGAPSGPTGTPGPIAAAGGIFDASAPPFAKSVKVYRIPESAPITVSVSDGAVVGDVISTNVPGGSDADVIQLPRGSSSIRVVNNDPANSIDVYAIFNLDL